MSVHRRPARAAAASVACLLGLASACAQLAAAGEPDKATHAEARHSTRGAYSQDQSKQNEPRPADKPLCLECGVLQRLSNVTAGRGAAQADTAQAETAQPISREPARATLSMIYSVDGQPQVADATSAQAEQALEDEPCKTAEVLIEIMDRARKNPLQGTLFESSADGATASESNDDRAMLVRFVRTLEREKPPVWPAARSEGSTSEWADAPRTAVQSSPDSVLRQAARQIDALAEQLEDHALYSRADGLRLLADQLRHDARCQRVESAFLRPFDSPHVGDDASAPSNQLLPERDVELELDAIHRELSRFREALGLPPFVKTHAKVNEPPSGPFIFGGVEVFR